MINNNLHNIPRSSLLNDTLATLKLSTIFKLINYVGFFFVFPSFEAHVNTQSAMKTLVTACRWIDFTIYIFLSLLLQIMLIAEAGEKN